MNINDEHPEESSRGYPEEQPSQVADDPNPQSDAKPQRQGGEADRGSAGSRNEDEGTATGNPNAAGAEGE
jgi:hypothetical protein